MPSPNHMNLFDFGDDNRMNWQSAVIHPAMILLVWPTIAVVWTLLIVWYWKVGRVAKVSNPTTYGFFHPHCSGGGGGERVLWKLVQYLQQQQTQDSSSSSSKGKGKVKIVIFTVDSPDTSEAKLRLYAQRRFDVTIAHPIVLVSLQEHQYLLRPRPFLSLVMESWGTMQLAYHALQKYPDVDVFCDTTGCAFTFCVARWMCPQAWILAYVHYPTISTDMMAWEWQQSQHKTKTVIKLVYYWIFATLYGMVGSLADLVLVNSTWTYNHVRRLWRFSRKIDIVYPPCRVPDISSNTTSTTTASSRQRSSTIVSIAQFRPEKNHALQLQALACLLQNHPEHIGQVTLELIGSCRNAQDQQRVDVLKDLVDELKIAESVKFHINPPYEELQASMAKASLGIHTMRQEHFGIGIVEMMAAGLLVVAHNSGGPRSDIVQPGTTGFLAISPEEYASALHQALTLPSDQATTMRSKAQIAATRFSDSAFDDALSSILPKLTERTGNASRR